MEVLVLSRLNMRRGEPYAIPPRSLTHVIIAVGAMAVFGSLTASRGDKLQWLAAAGCRWVSVLGWGSSVTLSRVLIILFGLNVGTHWRYGNDRHLLRHGR
ncbi:hypothetical protein KCP69_22490 [Salmonella enterica subsp. enterica]|nr:hypothetical protein KCP69_22490 [Salmonella enterica subsp. enterica]